MDPIAERADQLAGPQGAERAVEREADVRVAPDPLEDRRDGREREPPRPPERAPPTRSTSRRATSAAQAAARRALPRSAASAIATSASRLRARRCRACAAAGRQLVERGGARRAAAGSRRRRHARARSGADVIANRKNARPAARNRSPMLATLRMNGIGIGMMSPSGPAWARKSPEMPPLAAVPTITWNADPDLGRAAGRPRGCSAPRPA